MTAAPVNLAAAPSVHCCVCAEAGSGTHRMADAFATPPSWPIVQRARCETGGVDDGRRQRGMY